MRAVVAGGAGFLGSGLVDRLLAEGWAVEVIDDLSTGTLANLSEARADRSNELRIHQHDVRDPTTAQLVERLGPDVLFHLAAARSAAADVLGTAAVGTHHLLGGATAAACEKVVAVLSGAALHAGVEPAEIPVKESVEPSPCGPRGIAEVGVLTSLRASRERHLLEHTAVVVPTVYGPRQRADAGPVAAIADASASGGPATIPGSATDTEDLLFVDDAVDAIVRAVDRGGGLVLHASSGVETSLSELVEEAAECGASFEVRWSDGDADRPSRLALDPGRARIHLGWSSFTDLAAGLRATLRDARDRSSRAR